MQKPLSLLLALLIVLSVFTVVSVTVLYGSSQGTKVGSVSATGTVTFSAPYEYVGIRSSNGAIYLSRVEIEWETGASVPTHTVTWNNYDGTTVRTDTVAEDTDYTYTGAAPVREATAANRDLAMATYWYNQTANDYYHNLP